MEDERREEEKRGCCRVLSIYLSIWTGTGGETGRERRGQKVGRGEGSRRLNREEIECSSNIEEDSGFARIVSIRPLSDSSSVHLGFLLPSPACGQGFSFAGPNRRTLTLLLLLPVPRYPYSTRRNEPLAETSSRKFNPRADLRPSAQLLLAREVSVHETYPASTPPKKLIRMRDSRSIHRVGSFLR